MVLTIDKQAFPESRYNGLRGRMRATAELTMQHNREADLLEWRAEVTLGTDTHLLFSVLGTGSLPEEAAEDAFAEVDARAAVLALELRGGAV